MNTITTQQVSIFCKIKKHTNIRNKPTFRKSLILYSKTDDAFPPDFLIV